MAARQTKANPRDKTLESPHQVRQLRELIDALDARVPMIERIGENQIARDAALLKKSALQRITELETEQCCPQPGKKRPGKRRQ